MTFLYLSLILFDIKLKNFASIREQNGKVAAFYFSSIAVLKEMHYRKKDEKQSIVG
jgi:hypothetical protein